MLQEKKFGKLNSDAGDHDLPEEDYRDSYNLIPVKEGAVYSMRRQTMKGNVLIPSTEYGAGAKTVGSYYDEKNNRVIWLNVNSNEEVDIFYYYPATDTIEKRVASDLFDITSLSDVNTLLVIDHYVLWVGDDGSIRQYDLDHEGTVSTFFTGNDKVVLLNRPQPFRSPWSIRQTNLSSNVNKITAESFQFAYQFVYKDGARSVISPTSATSIGDKIPLPYNDTTNNTIRVYMPYQDIDTLDYIEVLYRKNQDDDYYKFREIRDLTNTIVTSDPSNAGVQTTCWYVDFSGEEASTITPQEDVLKKYESIPKITKAITFAKSRLFAVRTQQNTPLGDIDSVVFTAQAHNDSPIQSTRGMYLMPGTTYVVGLEFFNEDMESTTVIKQANIEVPDVLSTLGVESMLNTTRYRARINISGPPPTGFERYRILMTRNQKYSEWVQASMKFMFWKEEYIERDQEPDSQSYRDLDDVYHIPLFLDNDTSISQIHLQLPLNLPFQVTTDHRVRIITDSISGHPASSFDVERVLRVEGDKAVVGNFGKSDWSFIEENQLNSERLTSMIICEIFKPNEAVESVFYEVGYEYRIREAGGTRYFGTQEIYLDGDVFEWGGQAQWMNRYIPRSRYDDSYGEQIRGFQQAFTATKVVNVSESITEAPESFAERFGFVTSIDWGVSPFYTLDYGKIAADRGRTNVKAPYNLIKAGYSLSYSKIYKSNTNLNGLNNFDSDGTYDLDLEEGDIQKLIMIHDNLMLAIHTRSVTSLYLGESFIKQANSIDIVTKTEGIIGQHRVAQGQYGTINPESVVSADGKVYWWDALRGSIVRYDNNGLDSASSEADMKTFFEELADELRPYRDKSFVVGTFHEMHDLIIWTFKPIVDDFGTTVFAGLTIGYHYQKKAFVTKFSFLPERYARIPQTVVSFLNGMLYKHDENDSYGTFYGVSHLAFIRMLLNKDARLEKIWENLIVDANEKLLISITAGDQYTEINENDYFQRHSTLYADIMRDMNTPVTQGKNAKITGDTMLSKIAELYITMSAANALKFIEINEVHVGYRLVSGHFLEEEKK